MNSSVTLVPVTPILPPANGDRVTAEPSFSLNGEGMRSAFGATRIYPVSLASASVYDSAVQLYVQWLDLIGAEFSADTMPWLPVGRVGPMLVLGHYQPAIAAPLPASWFQPVLLKKSEYERHLRMCAPIIEKAERPDWEESLAQPRREFPGTDAGLIKPTTVRAALRFLIEYFPHARADLTKVQELLMNSDDVDQEELPAGYFGAAWMLLERGGIADPTVIVPPEQVMRRVPVSLMNRIRVIAEYGHSVWVGMERLPQPDVEDCLLNELGDGWHVHFLLLDGIRFIDKTPGAEAFVTGARREETESKSGGRPRVKIEDARSRARGTDGGREPGVIRLSQKDIRELDSYNPRRADRDPSKVFLKELSAGIQQSATDIHIEPGLDCYRIRTRIDGLLEEWLEMPLDFGRMVTGAAKEMFGMPPERYRPQDGACTVFHGAETVNLRISTYPIRGEHQKIVIRFLPRRGEVPRLEDLMPPKQAAWMLRACTRPFGLILVCGPTGSGKTTTTFSALAEINTDDVNITTMEDPVEYQMDRVNQAELDKARGVDWDTLLEGFLRQDPDIGMVGEIRNRETADTAIRLTLTGHIVFATMHTMSCAATVERLVDMGVNATMFSNAATLIVSQRLLRRVCKRCKEAGRRKPTPAEQKLFERHAVDCPEFLYDAVHSKCEGCRGKGYKGQLAAIEMLPVTDEVAEMIGRKATVREIEAWMKKSGYPRIFQSALGLVAKGETTLEEANEWQAVWEEMPTVIDKTHLG